jgi:asparagine synthase (glutamine-hydrolysing)
MCGIAGVFDMRAQGRIDRGHIARMAGKLSHRGPDESDFHVRENLAMGFSRLGIIDLQGGKQPMQSEDGATVSICNGEIFNWKDLRTDLEKKGHRFLSRSDCEVILHLYRAMGRGFPERLNGQFAFSVFDAHRNELFCGRDQFGIAPFFYTVVDGIFLFASEIKALLEHPRIDRALDPVGLDQVLTFPGLISPRTAFRNIHSLRPGHCLIASSAGVRTIEYWDLKFPLESEPRANRSLESYIEELEHRFMESVRLRLQADVPVGLYLSGGLDSMLVGAKMRQAARENAEIKSFSVDFEDALVSEGKFQRVGAKFLGTVHNEILVSQRDIGNRLRQAVIHAECPLKETFNSAALALSASARKEGVKVVLAGQGADELFHGYIGYRFDARNAGGAGAREITGEEAGIRRALWGDESLLYERSFSELVRAKRAIYSESLRESQEEIECTHHFVLDKSRIEGLHKADKRSYLDLKLRLADHLLGDHGDRMLMAHSVEGRYPFLDPGLAGFAAALPQEFKVNGLCEKFILKEIGKRCLPRLFSQREKFGFTAPGSPHLLRAKTEIVEYALEPSVLRRQGIFDPDEVARLRTLYESPGYRINVPFESDLLVIVITTGILVDHFGLGGL